MQHFLEKVVGNPLESSEGLLGGPHSPQRSEGHGGSIQKGGEGSSRLVLSDQAGTVVHSRLCLCGGERWSLLVSFVCKIGV